jgi:hypothetical protein
MDFRVPLTTEEFARKQRIAAHYRQLDGRPLTVVFKAWLRREDDRIAKLKAAQSGEVPA